MKKLKFLLFLFFLLSILAGSNWLYHAWNNPAIVLHHVSSLSGQSWKTPKGTWQRYGNLFISHETDLMTAEFLAAIAQNESGGNAIVTTYWRWKWSSNPLEWYAPASTSAGLYQYTKGTFKEAKKYCVHYGKPVLKGSWNDLSSCWFNGLYSRLLPSHAIEMTAARLHYLVEKLVEGKKLKKEDLRKVATVIHLCGQSKARRFVNGGVDYTNFGQCGSHSPKAYFQRIEKLRQKFLVLRKN